MAFLVGVTGLFMLLFAEDGSVPKIPPFFGVSFLLAVALTDRFGLILGLIWYPMSWCSLVVVVVLEPESVELELPPRPSRDR